VRAIIMALLVATGAPGSASAQAMSPEEGQAILREISGDFCRGIPDNYTRSSGGRILELLGSRLTIELRSPRLAPSHGLVQEISCEVQGTTSTMRNSLSIRPR
jgi:hypothetical protein